MSGILLDSTRPGAVIDAIKAKLTWRNMEIRAGAGYVDGPNSQWPAAGWLDLKNTGVRPVSITVLGNEAMVGDVENGDLTPASGATWAQERAHKGEWPVLYVNRSNKPATIVAAAAAGLEPERDFGLWVATLDGTFADDNGNDLRGERGVVAVQYLQDTHLDVDVSDITAAGAGWLGLTQQAPPWQARALNQAQNLVKLLEAHQ